MDEFRERLLAEHAEIVEHLESGDDHPVVLDQTKVGRLSRMDALQSQALAQNMRRRRQHRLLAIAKALRRIGKDEFGYCLDCGEDMETKRLAVDAASELCILCAQKKGL